MGDTDSTKRRTVKQVNMASTRQDVINALISESAKGADFPDSKRDFFKSRLTRDDLVYVLKQIKPEASVTQKDNKTALLDLIIENGALKTSSSSSPSESSSPSGSSSPSELSSHSDAPAPKPVSEPMEPVPELAPEPMEPVPEVDELASEPMEPVPEVDEVELVDNAGLQGLAQVATDPEERSIVETCPAMMRRRLRLRRLSRNSLVTSRGRLHPTRRWKQWEFKVLMRTSCNLFLVLLVSIHPSNPTTRASRSRIRRRNSTPD